MTFCRFFKEDSVILTCYLLPGDAFFGGWGGMTALILIADGISRLQSVESQKKSLILRPLPVLFFSLSFSLCCICSSAQNCNNKKKRIFSGCPAFGYKWVVPVLVRSHEESTVLSVKNANLWPHPLAAAHKHPADK